jgi:hypothetical protein
VVAQGSMFLAGGRRALMSHRAVRSQASGRKQGLGPLAEKQMGNVSHFSQFESLASKAIAERATDLTPLV